MKIKLKKINFLYKSNAYIILKIIIIITTVVLVEQELYFIF